MRWLWAAGAVLAMVHTGVSLFFLGWEGLAFDALVLGPLLFVGYQMVWRDDETGGR